MPKRPDESWIRCSTISWRSRSGRSRSDDAHWSRGSATSADTAKHPFSRARQSVSYSELMALITVLRAAGYLPEKAPAIWGACARVMTIVRWACAAAVVCSLHVGGVMLALMHSPEEEADVASAVTVELAAPLPAPVR